MSGDDTRPGDARIDRLRIDRGDETAGGGSRRLGLVVGVVVMLVVIAGALAWLVRPSRPEVGVSPVRAIAGGGSAGAVLNASGYVTARRQATVSSKITAKVVEVLVEEGMVVAEGQVLARLDDATPRAALALAEAELAAAEKRLAENRVRLAEARLNRERMERLVADDVASQADLDAAAAAEGSYAARLEVGREEIVVARRRLALASQDLADTVIRAPFAGVAVSKDAQAVRETSEGGERGVVLVLTADGESVERRAVRLGAVSGDEVEVLAGLTAGERVVTVGPATLAEGDRVRVNP